MRVTFDEEPTAEDLEHFGVKGMKWGVRRRSKNANYRDSLIKTKGTEATRSKLKNLRKTSLDQYLAKRDIGIAKPERYRSEGRVFKRLDTKNAEHWLKHSDAMEKKLNALDLNQSHKKYKKAADAIVKDVEDQVLLDSVLDDHR